MRYEVNALSQRFFQQRAKAYPSKTISHKNCMQNANCEYFPKPTVTIVDMKVNCTTVTRKEKNKPPPPHHCPVPQIDWGSPVPKLELKFSNAFNLDPGMLKLLFFTSIA